MSRIGSVVIESLMRGNGNHRRRLCGAMGGRTLRCKWGRLPTQRAQSIRDLQGHVALVHGGPRASLGCAETRESICGLGASSRPDGQRENRSRPGGHDDLCNAAALAMVSATTVQRGPRLFFGQISKPRQSNGQRGNSYRTVHSGHAIQSQQGKLK